MHAGSRLGTASTGQPALSSLVFTNFLSFSSAETQLSIFFPPQVILLEPRRKLRRVSKKTQQQGSLLIPYLTGLPGESACLPHQHPSPQRPWPFVHSEISTFPRGWAPLSGRHFSPFILFHPLGQGLKSNFKRT